MKTVENVLADLIHYIREKQLKVGDKLPPERELAKALGTSRPTLRKILDQFEALGSIERHRKGGTVIVENLDPSFVKRQAQTNIISFITVGLTEKQYELKQAYLQDQLLDKGYVLNTYYSSKDRQNPDKEKQYLRSLFRVNPKGLIITASPYGQTNESLLPELEKAGIRVVHMHYYKDMLPHEAFVLPDWCYAGAAAVSLLLAKGCKKLMFAHPSGDVPTTRHIFKGLKKVAEMHNVELLPHCEMGKSEDVVNGKIKEFVKKLPEKTGIITIPQKSGRLIANEMARQREQRIADQPVVAIDESILEAPEDYAVPCLNFPWKKRIQAAIDYITNADSISPCRELFLPELIIP